MALQVNTNRSRRVLPLAGTFFALFALFVQPLLALNIPAAFAASAAVDNIVFSPVSATINANEEKEFTLKFRHGSQSESLDSAATVQLSTNSATGQFADGTGASNPWTHAATYSTGTAASKTFRYKDSTAGNKTITAQVSGGGLTTSFETKTTVTVISAVASDPMLSLDTYFVKNSYRGIATDIKVNNLTDATSVTVEVTRSTGGTVTKTAKSSLIGTLNAGSSKTVTAPIVIQSGTYNEPASGSWNEPVGNPWTNATTPTSLTVTITRENGSNLVMSMPITASMGPFATLSEVMPVKPSPTIVSCTTTENLAVTSLSEWNLSETRATGHNEMTADGVHVWTEGSTNIGPRTDGVAGTWNTDKAAAYKAASFKLSELGEGFGLELSGSDPTPPGLQLVVDLDNNGTPEGNLVSEPAYAASTLWLSNNWTGIDLSSAPATVNGGGTGKGGTVNAWLAAFPDAKIMAVGYSLGSGVKGDFIIKSLTAGCTKYVFALPPADTTAPQVTSVVLNGKSVAVARDSNCGPTDFNLVRGKITLNATISDGMSGVKDAKYKIRKVTDGGCTQTGIYQSSNVNLQKQHDDSWVTLAGSELNTADTPTDGTYTIQMTVTDNAGNAATKYVDIRVDNTAPNAPVITKPTNRQWFKTSPINTTWSAAHDTLSGIKSYEVEYVYEQNGKTVTVYRDAGNNLSRKQTLSGDVDTKFTTRVRAIDNAGNVGVWSAPVYYYFDDDAPVGNITSLSTDASVTTPNGKLKVGGTVMDNMSMNRVGVQLVKVGKSGHIDYLYDHMVNQNPGSWEVEFDAAALELENGSYGLNVYFTDMAGNTSIKQVSFMIANPVPSVLGENFNTHSGNDYKGLNVGFSLSGFASVSAVTVELYNADTRMAVNTHNQKLLDLINAGTKQLSTPFITIPGTYDEEYWTLGDYNWAYDSARPTHAVVTVTGTNNLGQTVTKSNDLDNIAEPNGWAFASVLPSAPKTPISPVTDGENKLGENDSETGANTGGESGAISSLGQRTIARAENSSVAGPQIARNADDSASAAAETEGDVLGESDNSRQSGDDNGDVLAATDDAKDGCWKIMGVCWYWVLPPAAIVGFGVMWYAFSRRSRDDDPFSNNTPPRRQG